MTLDNHDGSVWDMALDSELWRDIKWKPLVAGIGTHEGYIILRPTYGSVNFLIDYMKWKLGCSAKVVNSDNSIIVQFDPENELRVRNRIPALVEVTRGISFTSNLFPSVASVRTSYLPENDETRRPLFVITPKPFSRPEEFFSVIQKLVSRYADRVEVFFCHSRFEDGSWAKVEKEVRIHPNTKEGCGSDKGYIVGSKQVGRLLEIVYGLHAKGDLQNTEEMFIIEGVGHKTFRLEGDEACLELQEDVPVVEEFFTGKPPAAISS